MRNCSKQGCGRVAVGTLTYDYQAQTAVLGPLASSAEPHTYDLCETHVRGLTVPRGWDVVRLDINYDHLAPSDDDLMELAEAVKEAAKPRVTNQTSFQAFVPKDGEKPSGPRFEVVPGYYDDDKKESKRIDQTGPFASKADDTIEGS